jgi:hypothetical protein
VTISKDELRGLLKRKQEHTDLDYKRDLVIKTEGDKAAFAKDVLSLANSAEIGYIVTGVEDQTWKPVGITVSHQPERLYQVMRGKSDPPVTIEYGEFSIGSRDYGLVKILGDNPPYVVSVADSFGGRSSGRKDVWIHRGTIFIRNINANDGVARSQLDKLYHQAEVSLTLKVRRHPDIPTDVVVETVARNSARQGARSIQMLLKFPEASGVMSHTGTWRDVSRVNENVPAVCIDVPIVHHGLPIDLGGLTVHFLEAKQTVLVNYDIRGENVLPQSAEATIEIEPSES